MLDLRAVPTGHRRRLCCALGRPARDLASTVRAGPELAEAAAALGRLASALEASGLGGDADVEHMPRNDEYEMRESLAKVIYDHEGQ